MYESSSCSISSPTLGIRQSSYEFLSGCNLTTFSISSLFLRPCWLDDRVGWCVIAGWGFGNAVWGEWEVRPGRRESKHKVVHCWAGHSCTRKHSWSLSHAMSLQRSHVKLEHLERVCGRREISIDCFSFPIFNWSKFSPWSFNSPECVVWPLWTAAGEAISHTPGHSVDTLGHSASSVSRN